MKSKKFSLSILPEKLAIFHLSKKSPIPSWVLEGNEFFSITQTPDEISVVCAQDKIRPGILAEKDWRALKVQGPLGFSLTGIVASLSKPLAESKISILYISTYETDYILVEEKNLEKAIEVLSDFCDIKR